MRIHASQGGVCSDVVVRSGDLAACMAAAFVIERTVPVVLGGSSDMLGELWIGACKEEFIAKYYALRLMFKKN